MLSDTELQARFEDTGDDALAKHVRDVVKELNQVLREMKRRDIGITLVKTPAGAFVVERVWVERPL